MLAKAPRQSFALLFRSENKFLFVFNQPFIVRLLAPPLPYTRAPISKVRE
jgi:hypothetical protein